MEFDFPEDHVYPTVNFEDFYPHFETVGELCQTDEYKNIYSRFYTFSDWEQEIPIGETTEDQELFSPEKQEEEIIRCASDFSYFCHRYVKLHHPERGIIPFTMYNFQRKTFNEYEKNQFNIISKFRQGGLTSMSCIWGLHKCMFSPAKIMFVSRSDREAVETAGETVLTAMGYVPSWMYDQSQYESTKHEIAFKNLGSSMKFYTTKATRGKTVNYLIIDEAAFIKDMQEEYKAMYSIISKNKGTLIAISTVNGVGDWYHTTYSNGKSKKNNFNVIDIDFWEHPNYANPEWARETRENLGEAGWRREILRDFMGTGVTYFRHEDIQRITKEVKKIEPIRTAFLEWTNTEVNEDLNIPPGALHIFVEPKPGHEYVLAADCAEGGGDKDNFSIQIIDAISMEQVAEFYSNMVDTTSFASIVRDLGYYYNNALVAVEKQNTGSAIIDILSITLGYDNLYKPVGTRYGVVMGTNRNSMVDHFRNRLSNASVKINSKRIADELATFVWNGSKKRPEARSGCHDDAIMAFVIAVHVRDKEYRNLADPSPDLKEGSATSQHIRKEIFGEDAPNLELQELKDFKFTITGEVVKDQLSNYQILKEFNFI